MNERTLRKTLDDYGFETENVLDCLLDVFVAQNVSEQGVLSQDVSGFTGVLQSYHLLEKKALNKLVLFKCTHKGERIAEELLRQKIPPVFEKFKEINLEGTYLVLKYLSHLLNQRFTPSPRPELKLLSTLPAVQEMAATMNSLLLEHGIARKAHQYTASGPAQEISVVPPDLYQYFEVYYLSEEKIPSFEQVLESVSRRLNLFQWLSFYEPRTEKIFLRKLKDYQISLEEISGILEKMKQENLIESSHDSLYKIEDREGYKTFLRENVLSPVLEEFSHQMHHPIHTNAEAYTVLAEFEEEFRTFLEDILKGVEGEWEERIPSDVLQRLEERQNDAKVRKKKIYSLLHYIDFPNYLSIILHRTEKFSNWDLFEPYFISIGWIKGRLIEMNEIRNDLAHPKPLEQLQLRKLQLYIDEIRERMKRG